jgi:hypothetical protein
MSCRWNNSRASNWCYCLINHCRANRSFWQKEGFDCLVNHLQQWVIIVLSIIGHETLLCNNDTIDLFSSSFIIVAQPTGTEDTAVTQYTKTSSGHSARLNCRIICLLDPVLLKDYIKLSDIGRMITEWNSYHRNILFIIIVIFFSVVTLYPLDRTMNDNVEEQPALVWQTRTIRSAEGVPISMYYAELHTIQLEKFDATCKRLLLNSTLCQLEFRLKIQVDNNIILCSISLNINHCEFFFFSVHLGWSSSIRRLCQIDFSTICYLFTWTIFSEISR